MPIAYFEYEGKYLIVASNWGMDKHADWYLNLKKTRHASLEVNGNLLPVTTREALGDEYDHLWKFVTQSHPPYLNYQKITTRTIPIMIFEQDP